MNTPDLIIKVKVLSENEGGRKTPFLNGYRAQFFYNDSDWDPSYEIIGKSEAKLGEEVELQLQTTVKEIHFGKFEIGKEVKIREGRRIVAEGKVIKILNKRFWKQYPKSRKRYSKLKLEDLEHDFVYYLITDFLKQKEFSDYQNFSKKLLKMSDTEFDEYEKRKHWYETK